MNTIERLAHNVLLGVAAFRITRLLQKDKIIKDWREDWLYPRFPFQGAVYGSIDPKKHPINPPSGNWITSGTLPNGNPRWVQQKGTFIGEMWHCPWCLSMWVCIFLTIKKNPFRWFIDCVSVAGFAMIARVAAKDS